MPSKSVKELEAEIVALLAPCPSRAQWMYQQMRQWLIENFPGQAPSLASGRIPDDVPGRLAERESGSVPSLLSRLGDAGLLVKRPVGYDLPQAARILEIRSRDATRQAKRRASTCRGVTSHPSEGVTSHPPNKETAEKSAKSDVSGVMSHPMLGADGCDVTPSTPPLVSSPPITPSSSLPPTHTFAGARDGERPEPPEPVEDLDTRLRNFLGAHPRILWNPRVHANCLKLVASGGWNGMVEALDEAVARGVGEPTSYALVVMAGRQAERRLKAERRPTPTRVTKARTFNV